MEISNEIFKKNLIIASSTNRNFIIDQTNVILYSRIEKLQLFEDFRKEAVVLVLTEQEQKKRMIKKERFLSKNSFLYPKLCLESFRNLQENFILPDDEGFDSITYAELDEEKTRKLVYLYNSIASKQIHPLLREKNYVTIKNNQDKIVNEKNKILFEDNNAKFNKNEAIDEKAFNDLIELEKESMDDLKTLASFEEKKIFPAPTIPTIPFNKVLIQEKNIVQQPQILYAKSFKKNYDNSQHPKPFNVNNSRPANNYYNNNSNFNQTNQRNNNYNNNNMENRQNSYNMNKNNHSNFKSFSNNPNRQSPRNQPYNNNRGQTTYQKYAPLQQQQQPQQKPNQFQNKNQIANPNNTYPTFNQSYYNSSAKNLTNNSNPINSNNSNNSYNMNPFSNTINNNSINNNGNNNNMNNNNNQQNNPRPKIFSDVYTYNIISANDKKVNNPSVITNYSNYSNPQTQQTPQIFPTQYMNPTPPAQQNYNYLNNNQNNYSGGSLSIIPQQLKNNNNNNQIFPNNNKILENANLWGNVLFLI